MAFPLLAAAMGLAEFAPVIARWLGGEDAQDVAHQVVSLAKSLTGVEDPLDAVSFLKKNSELVLAFQKEVLAIETQRELAYLKDRKDARLRDVRLIQAGRGNYRADIMVVSAALGLVMCLGSLAYYSGDLPGEAVGIISTIAGIFGACLKDAYAFEFGSSRGSKEKDSTVAAILEKGGF